MQSLTIPASFRPLFWSYDFSKMDPLRHKKTIIVQVLNYGTLGQWRWLVQTYGREGLRDTVSNISATEFKADALRLAPLLLGVDQFNYAPRGDY